MRMQVRIDWGMHVLLQYVATWTRLEKAICDFEKVIVIQDSGNPRYAIEILQHLHASNLEYFGRINLEEYSSIFALQNDIMTHIWSISQ